MARAEPRLSYEVRDVPANGGGAALYPPVAASYKRPMMACFIIRITGPALLT